MARKRASKPRPWMGEVTFGEPDVFLPGLQANEPSPGGCIRYYTIDPNERYRHIHERFGFAGGTQILLRDEPPRDTCPIENLQRGQEVVAAWTRKWITRPCAVREHTIWDLPQPGEMHEVEVRGDQGHQKVVVVTPHQPFFVYHHGYDSCWEPAFSLRPGVDLVLILRADAFYAVEVSANRIVDRGEGGIALIHRVTMDEPHVLVANGFLVADAHDCPVKWMAPEVKVV